MFELMKLEWQKHHLSSYFKGLAICILGIFVAIGLMAVGSKGESEQMFLNYEGFMSLANIFIRITFIIFSSVILSRLVIDEYKSKTIQFVFTYPIQRKKLLQAKLAIVFFFCFFSIVVTTFIISMLTFFLNPTIGFFETPVSMNEIIATVPTTLIHAFMMAGVSLIPLYFGMRKKSTATTITSAVLIGFLINASVPNGGSLFEYIGVSIVFSLLGLITGYCSYYKIDKIDVS